MSRRAPHTIIRDIALVALSAALAVLFVRTGIITELLAATAGLRFLGAFLAGMFFVSVFTVAPAAAVLVEFFQAGPLGAVALAGGLGALAGDWLMFRFLRDHAADDIRYLFERAGARRLLAVFHLKCFRWLTPLIGAIIVASPLPDEIGLALMGLSRLSTAAFLPISFALNFLGLLALGLAVKALG